MTIDAAGWYDTDLDPTSFFQGDIIEGVPVVVVPPAGSGKWVLLRPGLPVTREQALAGNTPKVFRPFVAGTALDEWVTPDELVLAKATKRAIIVITQTCDLERRNYVQVAPVYPARTLSASKQASLEKNEINYLFFLPMAEAAVPEKCFADLSQITSVHKSYMIQANLKKRLSNEGRARLQMHLSTFHGRPFGFSAEDVVQQDGEHLCLRCFLTSAIVERKSMIPGVVFGTCTTCGPRALWIKFS
jgi:hypothetical protein